MERIRKIMELSQGLKFSIKYRTISKPTNYIYGYGYVIGNKKSLKKLNKSS